MNDEPAGSTSRRKNPKRWQRRIWQVLLLGFLLLSAVLGWFLFDNNYSNSKRTAEQVTADLDRALDRGVKWMVDKRNFFDRADANSALMYMIQDMREPVQIPELEDILATHLENRSPRNFWRKMIAPGSETERMLRRRLRGLDQFQRWMAYAIDPDNVELTDEDKAAMFSPTKNKNRDLTHQLMAIDMYQDFGFAKEDYEPLLGTLCERIASECTIDFRVTDMYLQRVACILAAGRPDLVKRRWIERIIENQADNGGYHYAWNGWGPNLFKVFDNRGPLAHASVQGIWVLYMIRHRYPEWIEKNYPG